MKTKSTRKRLLVSSVSMLLVSMLALGTATYAWFTQDPNATAKGMTLRATAAKGLVIQTGSHANVDPDFWGHTDFLNYKYDTTNQKDASDTTPIALSATSFNVTGDFTGAFTVDAAADDDYKAKDDTSVDDSPADAYYQEIIKCKLTGGETDTDTDTVRVKNIKLTNKGKNMSNALRIALQYTYDDGNDETNDTKLIGVYAPVQRANKYITQKGAYSSALSSSNYTFTAVDSNLNTDAGTVDTTGKGYFTVTVYLDGEDSTCFTNNIQLADLISDITLDLILKSSATT